MTTHAVTSESVVAGRELAIRSPGQTTVEIFRAGEHTSMAGEVLAFAGGDLDRCVAAYDPILHEAPVVIGHPATDAPAYGWVKSLLARGGRLVALLGEIDPAFAELVRAGRFKKISASFYRPDSPSNPQPGSWYLRHVGFLGAEAPAVKGLRPVSFAAAADGVASFEEPHMQEQNPVAAADVPSPTESESESEFDSDGATPLSAIVLKLFRGLREHLIEIQGIEAADRVLPSATLQLLGEADAPSPTAAAFAEPERPARTLEDALFLDRLVGEGRLPPARRGEVASFLALLDAERPVAFSETASAATPRDWFKSFLKTSPRAIEFGEIARAERTLSLDDPRALAEAARQHQDRARKEGRLLSIADSVTAIIKGS